MTDEEKQERRERLAKAMGYWQARDEPREWFLGNSHDSTRLPDFDTDPAAREGLLEWLLLQKGEFISCIERCVDSWWVYGPCNNHDEGFKWWGKGDTYPEVLLSAIDAAIIKREKTR